MEHGEVYVEEKRRIDYQTMKVVIRKNNSLSDNAYPRPLQCPQKLIPCYQNRVEAHNPSVHGVMRLVPWVHCNSCHVGICWIKIVSSIQLGDTVTQHIPGGVA